MDCSSVQWSALPCMALCILSIPICFTRQGPYCHLSLANPNCIKLYILIAYLVYHYYKALQDLCHNQCAWCWKYSATFIFLLIFWGYWSMLKGNLHCSELLHHSFEILGIWETVSPNSPLCTLLERMRKFNQILYSDANNSCTEVFITCLRFVTSIAYSALHDLCTDLHITFVLCCIYLCILLHILQYCVLLEYRGVQINCSQWNKIFLKIKIRKKIIMFVSFTPICLFCPEIITLGTVINKENMPTANYQKKA